MLRLMTRHADWRTVSWTGLDRYRKLVAACERACTEVNRAPATLRRTGFGGCVCARTEAAVQALNKNHIQPDNAFVGTPVQVREQMRSLIDLGVDYFMLRNGGFPDPTTPDMLISEVLPVLNR